MQDLLNITEKSYYQSVFKIILETNFPLTVMMKACHFTISAYFFSYFQYPKFIHCCFIKPGLYYSAYLKHLLASRINKVSHCLETVKVYFTQVQKNALQEFWYKQNMTSCNWYITPSSILLTQRMTEQNWKILLNACSIKPRLFQDLERQYMARME